ncbi:hypothetical protein RB620_14950 [Paenibacillus sp. LHD-117]|uniref:hypothetical protein n=1 Tax=Paenibacillus sp. LHD-117 TaxID=3071412 RepID=UPI0027E1AAF1|nr:hypothetical protein [Paenibacillus sp. LHD-117]MDQ6420727.1 hypothetical protein [Paenibacillus sp. LHD-117]
MMGLWFGLYVLASALLLAIRYRKSWQEGLLRLIVVVAIPIIGWLLPLFWPKRLYANAGHDFHDYMTKQHEEHKLHHVGIYSETESAKELNVIPIEEALLVSEHQDRRRVMIDLLKQDSVHYLEILQTAVRNEDTETSHYAVSAIMEVKRKLLLSIQDLSVQFENRKEDEYVVRAYAEVLKGFLRSGFLDERTVVKYQYTYIEVLNQMIKLSKQAEWAYKDKMETEINLGLFVVAESTSLHYLDQHPESEDAYLCLMKVYYLTRSSSKLNHTLEQLKQSPVRLSNHALTLVRFWSEGA